MSENPNKQIKILRDLSEDLLAQVSSFLPIQSLLQNRTLSKAFRHTEIKSFELDFSGLHRVRRRQSDVVGIINNVMNNHVGPEIHRFVLHLNHIGVEGNILSWINMCIGKNIQELELDFSKSNRVMMIPIDFSAIKTLRVLKLRWCKFEILVDSFPRGLKHLKTLSLMRTTRLSQEMIDTIFINCIYLESLELAECTLVGVLNINAHNHKNFKSLVVSLMPTLFYIVVNAPTLKSYKFEGFTRRMFFLRPRDALEEAEVHYTRYIHGSDPYPMVVHNMVAFTKVSLLATTTIFLEALKYKYFGGGKVYKMGSAHKFNNLTTFRIKFKAPTLCTVFDIAEFLKACPNLELVVIDINDFTFERNMFWEIHYKYQIQSDMYLMRSLKEVKICGYKGDWHEFDIVKFFFKKAPSLEKLVLERPTNKKIKLNELYDAHIDHIKSISSRPNLIIESP